ncbi:MAG: NUDIX hydrolase [Thaumarchaeota archaeon]|nr:NUDIX hydrolase [Nitrososphaerota archaeon]
MRKPIYKGRVLSLSIYDVSIRGRRVKREVIEHPGAAAILAVENGKVLLVKQHRFPHGFVLEIPAGTMDRGESPKKCASRELLEETGHKARKMVPLVKFYPSIGYNTEVIHCFLASGLEIVSGLNLDDDEIISVVKMDLKKLVRMILSGRITDSKTICAVLTYSMKKKS